MLVPPTIIIQISSGHLSDEIYLMFFQKATTESIDGDKLKPTFWQP